MPRTAKKYKIINNFFNFIYFLIIFKFLKYLNSKLFIILKINIKLYIFLYINNK
jgi:hypothetical protein